MLGGRGEAPGGREAAHSSSELLLLLLSRV